MLIRKLFSLHKKSQAISMSLGLLVLLMAGACSRLPSALYTPPLAGTSKAGAGLPPTTPVEKEPVKSLRRHPFETWAFNRTLGGMELRTLEAIEGDQYRKQGEIQQAQKIYAQALSGRMSADERESLVLRKASMDLALGQASAALSTLSDYFKSTGHTVDEVDARFSLLFAYAYGFEADTPQALAWFSRTNRIEAGQSGLADIASDGLRLYLRSLADDEFYTLSNEWANDSFVSLHLGREARRRAAPDYLASQAKGGKFWELDGQLPGLYVEGDAIPTNTKIGVLLPLTGKFSRLGLSVQRGVELASLGQESQISSPVFRDTQGEILEAEVQFQQMVAAENIEVLLGPLLSDVAEQLVQQARNRRLPTIVFSKRGGFPTGESIFRLGPTFSSQVYSLVGGTRQILNMRNYALVYPQDPIAEEYARTFRQAVQDLGGSIAYEASYYPQDDNALVTIASQVEQSDVEGVFFPDTLVMAARFYGDLNPLLRSRIRLLGPAAWDSPTEIARSRAVLEGIVFVSPFFEQSKRPVVLRFIEAFKAKYDRDPDFLAAQGFDAATLAFGALKRKTEFGGSFESALRSISRYEGLTGIMEVGQDGEIRRTFPVVELKEGKLVELREVQKDLILG